jgi:hemoglobin/transferrin/lactoferrin receptor protein
MALTDNLDLTLAGEMMKEKLDSNDTYISYTASPFIAAPRKDRQEGSAAFNFDYRPTSWLELNAGAKYINGWVEDDFLKENLNNRTRWTDEIVSKTISTRRMLTSEEYSRARDLGWESSGPNDGTYDNLLILAKVLNRVNEYGQPVMQYGTGSNGIFTLMKRPPGSLMATAVTPPRRIRTITARLTLTRPRSIRSPV